MNRLRRGVCSTKFFIFVLALIFAPATFAQEKLDLAKLFDKREVMVPVRDGIKLHTEIYTPKNASGPLPIMFERTPYGISAPDKGMSGKLYRYQNLFADGYIFVFQDVRGKFESEGEFIMVRTLPLPGDKNAITESTDTYDSIDWMIKNIPNNNGRVGMNGISYPGFLVVMGMVNPHPALKAVSEQACMGDAWMGDDFYHNGAFRLSYGFEYSSMMETGKEVIPFAFDRFDTYDFYLRMGALSNANEKYFHRKIPTWNNFVAHPSYDEFWKNKAVAAALKNATVPNLNVAGWWDQEDMYGPLMTYERLEKTDKNNTNYLVAGPWNHGGWAFGPGKSLGEIPFHNDTGVYFREKIEAPWFAYWLHDKGTLPVKEATLFQTGSDVWTSFDAWPPKNATTKSLYFQENGALSFDAPTATGASAADSYVSDPARPVPYRRRPVDQTYPEDHPGSWFTWLVQDQRFVDNRPDVLTWQTGVLDQDVTVAGNITAKLFASTTGSDADWVVKLIDVYPEKVEEDWKLSGFQLMVANEIFRGRYRNSYEKPEPITPNQVTPFNFSLHSTNHVFKKGHRIMVQVQSTWFPLYDRNPQKFVANIFEAKDSDYQKATQTIYRSKQYPSSVEVMVLPAAGN